MRVRWNVLPSMGPTEGTAWPCSTDRNAAAYEISDESGAPPTTRVGRNGGDASQCSTTVKTLPVN